MREWALMLGGLLIWTAHFFLLYGIASVFPGTDLARILSLIATIPALAGDALLLRAALRRRATEDALLRWNGGLAAVGALISFVAVVWQGLPAIIV